MKKVILIIIFASLILKCSNDIPDKSEIEMIFLDDKNSQLEIKNISIKDKTISIFLQSEKIDFFKQTKYIDFQFLNYSLKITNLEEQFNIKYNIKYKRNDSTKMEIYFSKEDLFFYKQKYNSDRLSELVNLFEHSDFLKMDNIINLRTSKLPKSFDGRIHEIFGHSLADENNVLFEKHINTLFYIYIIDKESDYFKNKSELASKVKNYWETLNLNIAILDYNEYFTEYLKKDNKKDSKD